MNFFRTVIAICSGPSVFPKLIDRSPIRAFLHLILLCLLLAILITGIKVFNLRHEKAVLTTELGNYFGALTVSPKGVLPERNANVPKTFLLNGARRLDYFTKQSLSDLDSMNTWPETSGLFWTEQGVFFWKRLPDQKENYMMFQAPLQFSGKEAILTKLFEAKTYTVPELKATMEKSAFLKPGESYPASDEIKMQPKEIAANIVAGFAIFLCGTAFFGLFMLAAITTVLFALAQHFLGFKGERRLQFRQYLTTMIYAAFPALFLTALTMTFALPFFQFQTVFFIVFFIYQILAFGAIQRALNPPPPPDENENDFF